MTRFLAPLAVAALIAGSAQAQSPAAAPAAKPSAPAAAKTVTTKTPATKTPAKGAPVAHTAASIDCSKQADAKGLHGKARKTFRSSCKAAAKG